MSCNAMRRGIKIGTLVVVIAVPACGTSAASGSPRAPAANTASDGDGVSASMGLVEQQDNE
jgi:hypothetical protein